jgi:hypothetical protein
MTVSAGWVEIDQEVRPGIPMKNIISVYDAISVLDFDIKVLRKSTI